jgi:nucleoside-diphosphate-sugar epimerase
MISKTGSLNGHRILVTGASGFLGSRLVKALLDNGAFVVGIDSNKQFPEHFADIIQHKSFCFIHGGFPEKSDEALSELLSEKRGITAVFHMAGIAHAGECEENPLKAFKSHVLLTFQALEFCRQNKIGKFIFPSTGLVYGDYHRQPVTEETSPTPQNIYAGLKLSAEAIITGHSKSFKITCFIARLGNVYGPGSNEDTVVGTVIKRIKNGERIVVRDLTPIRDFIYVDDIIEGLIRLFVSTDKHGCYTVNLSTGIGTTIFNLVKMASRIGSVPINEVQPQGNYEPSNSTLILDNSLLKKFTGWKPRYTLSEGLSLTLKGYD